MILTDDMQTCFHSFALYYMQKKRRFMTGFLYPDINQRYKYVRITQNREQLKTVPDTAGDRNRTGTKFNPRRILSPVRLPVPPPRPPQANDGIRTRDPHLGKVVFYH